MEFFISIVNGWMLTKVGNYQQTFYEITKNNAKSENRDNINT